MLCYVMGAERHDCKSNLKNIMLKGVEKHDCKSNPKNVMLKGGWTGAGEPVRSKPDISLNVHGGL